MKAVETLALEHRVRTVFFLRLEVRLDGRRGTAAVAARPDLPRAEALPVPVPLSNRTRVDAAGVVVRVLAAARGVASIVRAGVVVVAEGGVVLMIAMTGA